jgi:hypothetical protein
MQSKETTVAQHNLGRMHYHGRGGPVDHAAAAVWWKRAADQGDADAITDLPLALTRLFPPGTRIELVKMPAPRLNGLRGVVDATLDGKIVYSGVGKIAVVFEGGQGTKAVLFEGTLCFEGRAPTDDAVYEEGTLCCDIVLGERLEWVVVVGPHPSSLIRLNGATTVPLP